ncbi:MAG TPA: hypothetical protein PKI11_08300 [Candidatus Hydrogenedentes bacterium]|nr:hypothetical protein [Candidatus Hydrogenedentota bacterium]
MSFIEALRHPPLLHAMAVHFPIVLAVAGAALSLCAAVFAKRKSLLWLTAIAYAALVAVALITVWTGERAMSAAPETLPEEVWAHIEAHESAAGTVWIAAAVAAVFALLAFIPHARTGLIMRLITCVAGLATVGLVGMTAHRGAMLVYEHGVGTALVVTQAAAEGQTAPPANASDAPAAETAAVLSQVVFQERVWPIIEARCLDCHAGEKAKSRLDLSTLEGLLRGGNKGGPTVVLGDPDSSVLIQYLEGTRQPRMPYRDDPLSEEDLAVFRDWIAAADSASR